MVLPTGSVFVCGGSVAGVGLAGEGEGPQQIALRVATPGSQL